MIGRVNAGLLALALLLGGCADDIQGNLQLLMVPVHQGRNPSQDPFELVEQVEFGWTSPDGDYRRLGQARPTSGFGPDLLGSQDLGSATLTGLNSRQRPVSMGFARPLALEDGTDELLTVPFARIDHAVAFSDAAAFLNELATWLPSARKAPTLRLDSGNLQKGVIDGANDAGCLVWVAWGEAGLRLLFRVTDDQVDPAAQGHLLADGDGLIVFLHDGAGGRVVTVSADGRLDPPDEDLQVAVANTPRGYDLRLQIPFGDLTKNQPLGFDLRLVDADEGQDPAWLTWAFDPRNPGDRPDVGEYGRLVPGTDVLHLIAEAQASTSFQGPDGPVVLSGGYDEQRIWLRVTVEDDRVLAGGSGQTGPAGDGLQWWLDLANGAPPAAEAQRFVLLEAGVDGSWSLSRGASCSKMVAVEADGLVSVSANQGNGGYSLDLVVLWSALQLQGGVAQRGWFLGSEIRVLDDDGQGAQVASWSCDAVLRPEAWPELRLFTLE